LHQGYVFSVAQRAAYRNSFFTRRDVEDRFTLWTFPDDDMNGALAIALVGVVGLAHLSGQVQECSSRDLSAAVQPTDNVYTPALEFSERLERGGLRVRCVLRSVWEGEFEGLVGAALYRTDRGDFDALFLSPPDTFDQLIVNERKEGATWVYSFQGEPKPAAANRIEGRRKMQFVKHGHRLLLVWDDEKLAAFLQRVAAAR
jgi:hypothetical protein